MEFGKVDLTQLDRIDLSLPPDDPRTWRRLEELGDREKPERVGIGCPVWGVKEWLGQIYPRGTDPKEFLYHYSRQFNTIELNTTHYRTPDDALISRWREQTPDGFKFCVKFLQEISHRYPLGGQGSLLDTFVSQVMKLEDRLGISFLQLPPNFEPNDLGELRKFLKRLPDGFQIAVEVRHPSFFVDHKLIPPLYDLLVEEEAHVVITDVAGRRDVLHTSLPSSRVLLRFIGNELHPTDDSRARDWVARLKTWFHLGLEQIEFFVHQPDDVSAPELIARITDLLNEECGLDLPKWKPQNQGEQLGFF